MVCPSVNVQILVVRLILALSSVTLAGNSRFEEAIAKYKEIIPMQNNMEKLEQLKTDIERCRKKMELLNL